MLFTTPNMTHLFRHAWVDEIVDLRFEDGFFPAPKGYCNYLKMYYGDDWQIPRQAPSTHAANGEMILDTSRSYLEVLKEINTKSSVSY